MKLNRSHRLRIAHEIRRQLPWAHIVVGAPRYNFLEVSRGESIRGAYSTGAKVGHCGSAWSRPWPGSYCLHIDLSGGYADCCRHLEPRFRETERMVRCIRWTIPEFGGRRGGDRLTALADWIVAKACTHIPDATREPTLLRNHERFEVRVDELDPLPLRVVGGAK